MYVVVDDYTRVVYTRLLSLKSGRFAGFYHRRDVTGMRVYCREKVAYPCTRQALGPLLAVLSQSCLDRALEGSRAGEETEGPCKMS